MKQVFVPSLGVFGQIVKTFVNSLTGEQKVKISAEDPKIPGFTFFVCVPLSELENAHV